MITRFEQAEACIDAIIDKVGKDISIGMPLGLGKPAMLINALYARAKADRTIHLRILTALTLEKPQGGSRLEAAFLAPFVERVYRDCPDIDYATDLSAGRLPPNVEVIEFFFKPGSRLKNPHAQQHYISCNYTHAARDVFEQGCNVAAQLVCKSVDGQRISLSGNPDTGPELIDLLKASGRTFATIGEVNQNLPYMYHDAERPIDEFDFLLDNPAYSTTLFSTPKQPVATADHVIGLHASSLIKDGGTLQIGIGALGDAIVHALCLRQRENDCYRQALKQVETSPQSAALIDKIGGRETFSKGLYGATEMFVDGFLHLYEAGVLKRRVYDDENLQQLLNDGRVDESAITPALLDGLEALGERVIRTHEFETLQYHGVFTDECRYELGHIIAPDGERIMANLAIPESRAKLAQKCLGTALRNGTILHGGFFLGPNSFYVALNAMDEAERRQFWMTGVYKINQLDHAPKLYKAQRLHARFVNTGLMVTLSGAVVSDGLADGRVVSGVGGQFNFVDTAHHLPTGRSILLIRAVRGEGAKASSNIVPNYGHCTIPRHLRDIIITEYGIADLRSQSDSEIIKRLLNVCDSRFQDELLAGAKRAGKIENSYQIPQAFRENRPERLEENFAALSKHFPAFPLGCDFTEDELKLARALKAVKAQVEATPKWKLLFKGLRQSPPPASAQAALERLGLVQAENLSDRIARNLLIETLP